jgi:FtsZ-binding cell division protein ZapB
MSNQIEELEEMVQNMIISINSLEGENKDLREKNLALNDNIIALNEENDKIKKKVLI